MAERMLDDQAIRELAVRLRDLEWSWSQTEVPAIAQELGWTVDGDFDGIIELDTGLGPASGVVEVNDEGAVDIIVVSATSYIDPDEPAERAWLRDGFAHATSLVTEALGEPTLKRPGSSPQVRWRGENSTLGVNTTSVSLKIFVARNDYLDDEDYWG
ncbi:DUF6301 family protein [Actinomadura verrucosospora]|uniref:Uncharacterized protein n=1 Tax=Actinomadura verrucosospora TaxID=46165 RepID=A0A7D3VUL6_ACTVE|nr:DUF6301 family protein [Actinomadura verrucosospora]QKG23460.1 hypothetical protein ACTIVE_5103 [Actinomadura verrucosospora]